MRHVRRCSGQNMSYVELHGRSAFSFLRAGSSPEELAAEAARLELPALALCDRDGFYGSVRLHTSAREAGLRAIVGVELTMEDDSVVPLLVATREGYRALSRLITTAKLRAPKGDSRVRWPELAEVSAGLFALTGDEEGSVLTAWRRAGTAPTGSAPHHGPTSGPRTSSPSATGWASRRTSPA